MLHLLLGLAAVVFIGKFAIQHLGKTQTLAILNRLFWILYAGWAGLILYSHNPKPDQALSVTPNDWENVSPQTSPSAQAEKPDPNDPWEQLARERAAGQAKSKFGGIPVDDSAPGGECKPNQFGDLPLGCASTNKPPAQPSSAGQSSIPVRAANLWHHFSSEWGFSVFLLIAPLIARYAVIFVATGRPGGHR